MKEGLKKVTLVVLLLWLLVWNTLLTFASLGNPVSLGIISMAWGLCIVWVLLAGGLMYRYRDRVRSYVARIKVKWQVIFVVFATLMALLEEAITVSLTNMAPLFGTKVGEAYITASANYFDVVLFHSVIVFIPLFIAWAIVLTKYRFSTFAVFIMFGIMGILAEISFGGPQQILGAPQWIFVYGLMIFLPAYCIPKERSAKPAGFLHHLIAVPAVLLIALPMLVPVVLVITKVLQHPGMHF